MQSVVRVYFIFIYFIRIINGHQNKYINNLFLKIIKIFQGKPIYIQTI
jgi:hypothetical protein